ncbi:Os01g0229250, partial [Oryza sativa Japonica Group]
MWNISPQFLIAVSKRVSARIWTFGFLCPILFLSALTTSFDCPGSRLQMSQISMFLAQSGPMSMSLVARSTMEPAM